MESKYKVTSNFTSLHALEKFIKLVKEAGGSISLSEDRLAESLTFDNPVLVPTIEVESIFSAEIKIYASSTIDLEKVKAVLNDESGVEAEKSAACVLLESVTKFTGVRPTCAN